MHLPSGDDWGCWPPGKRSSEPSAEREREKEMGMRRRDLCYNMNEQNNSGLETMALSAPSSLTVTDAGQSVQALCDLNEGF